MPRWAGVLLVLAWMAWIHRLSSGPVELDFAGDSAVWSFLANLAHAPLFGLLALWCLIALPRREQPFAWARLGRRELLAVLVFVGLFAGLDEWYQAHVPSRHGGFSDVLTDVAGAAAVLWVAHYAGHRGATASGLTGRLALGLAACALFAALATWVWDQP
jgi:VanZ family protein